MVPDVNDAGPKITGCGNWLMVTIVDVIVPVVVPVFPKVASFVVTDVIVNVSRTDPI